MNFRVHKNGIELRQGRLKLIPTINRRLFQRENKSRKSDDQRFNKKSFLILWEVDTYVATLVSSSITKVLKFNFDHKIAS